MGPFHSDQHFQFKDSFNRSRLEESVYQNINRFFFKIYVLKDSKNSNPNTKKNSLKKSPPKIKKFKFFIQLSHGGCSTMNI